MEVIVELARHRLADPRRLLEVIECGALHRPRRPKMHEERALTVRTDAWDFIQGRSRQAFRPLSPMRADRESVSFVAQALEIEQQSRVRRQRNLPATREMKHLPPLAAMVRSLGDTNDRHVVDPRILHYLADCRQLTLAAVDQEQVRPLTTGSIRIFLL